MNGGFIIVRSLFIYAFIQVSVQTNLVSEVY